MTKKDPESPATTSIEHDLMTPRWDRISAVLGGTMNLRQRPDLMPRHEEEGDATYAERLGRATLLNMTKLVLNSWVGMPFSDPIIFSEEMPDEIKVLLDDVDMVGNNLTVFARDWFKTGLAKAFSFTLVEMPKKGVVEGRTKRDDKEEALRPYWVKIDPEDVIAYVPDIVNGREIPVHVRVKETLIERAGFAQVVKNRIRVWDRFDIPNKEGKSVFVSLWEEKKKARTKKVEWVEVEPPTPIDLHEIPIVPFWADREVAGVGDPPIQDVNDLNLAHWQSDADQTSIVTVARFPMLAGSGVTDDDGKLAVGPREWLFSPDSAGRFYYVEHSGRAIAAGKEHGDDLVEKMSNYGIEFTKRRPDRESATARVMASKEATSPLEDTAIRFNDAMNNALRITGLWLDIEEVGTAKVITSFSPTGAESRLLDALRDARKSKDISRKKYLEGLQQGRVIPANFDFDGNDSELKKESEAAAALLTPVPPTGPPDVEE